MILQNDLQRMPYCDGRSARAALLGPNATRHGFANDKLAGLLLIYRMSNKTRNQMAVSGDALGSAYFCSARHAAVNALHELATCSSDSSRSACRGTCTPASTAAVVLSGEPSRPTARLMSREINREACTCGARKVGGFWTRLARTAEATSLFGSRPFVGNQSKWPHDGHGASSAGFEGSTLQRWPHTTQRFESPSGVRDEIDTACPPGTQKDIQLSIAMMTETVRQRDLARNLLWPNSCRQKVNARCADSNCVIVAAVIWWVCALPPPA
ncbi:hypothetical protein GobsT_49480 [Gemmata obscuriglobus]|nr:hypothetical protein GobsT_49480 [Gemmata obscuriglobus]VTS09468.1 unnamed protein product [Gemmata obscuriglobus UQM 2246]